MTHETGLLLQVQSLERSIRILPALGEELRSAYYVEDLAILSAAGAALLVFVDV